jgi:hypothetical protein
VFLSNSFVMNYFPNGISRLLFRHQQTETIESFNTWHKDSLANHQSSWWYYWFGLLGNIAKNTIWSW